MLALVLILGASTAYLFFREITLDRIDRSLSNTADAFIQSLVADTIVLGQEDQAVRDGLNEFRFRDLAIIVYDQNLTVIGVSADGPDDGPSALSERHPQRQWPIASVARRALRSGHTTVGFARLRDHGEVYRMYTRPATIGNQTYVLAVVQSLGEEHELLQRAKTVVEVAIPLILVLAGLGGAFLADRSLRPVAAMTMQAARIGEANSDERLPVHNPHDELGQLALVFNDLLGRLQHTLDRQRQFMADASHELRTPVAVIRAEVDVTLTQAQRDEAEYRDTLSTIGVAARRLSSVIDNLFLVARADTGQYPIYRVPTYLGDIVAESAKALRTVADTRGMELRVELPAEDTPYDGDVELLHRMVTNLIENALKHGLRDTTATVALHTSDREYTILVTNHAVDIPRQVQARIFDRFVQSATTPSTADHRDRGAGLGLPIARWIAQVHGGALTLVRSEGGTTVFQCTLARDVG